MDQREFLARLGFDGNPFQFTNADEEEHLQNYFVPPPYFHSVWGDPSRPQSQVIFAPRGGGKTAQRKMLEFKAQSENVFVITYDRFESLGGQDLHSLSLDYHVRNLIRIALLGFLLELHERGVPAQAFQASERNLVYEICSKYLGSINRSAAVEALKSLTTISTKAKQVLREWSGTISALVSSVLSAHGLAPVNLTSQGSVVPQIPSEPSKAHFEIVRDLIKSVGFKSVYVLIDKVDETSETGTNAEASFSLIKPMIRDLELLQMAGVGFKFFLWDRIEPFYREFARPDRIEPFELRWSEEDLRLMLRKRLEAFSSGRVSDLGRLTDDDFGETLHHLVVIFAKGSPRDMIRLCQSMLREQLQDSPESTVISLDAILQGLRDFSEQRARELVPSQVLKELQKVGRLDFTANYIANDVFKIEVNSARNKIVQWTQTGVVEKVGDLYTGGRPVYHYAVTDIRVALAIVPQQDVVDFYENKVEFCPKCRATVVRDWDLRPNHTCQECGLAFDKSGPIQNNSKISS